MFKKEYLAECFGTMFLVLLACGSAVLAGPSIGGYGVGVCFGLTLLGLCYAIGNISGCHVNPAVSIAVWLNGGMKAKDCCMYIVYQLVGALIGAAFLYMLTECVEPETFHFGGTTAIEGSEKGASIAANVLQPGATSELALMTEILLTFFFVFVVIAATDAKVGAGKFAGAAIGLALGLVNIVGIPVDNCSVNPARSFGPAVFGNGFGDFWIMVVGPVVGAVVAVLCWKAIAPYVSKKGIE